MKPAPSSFGDRGFEGSPLFFERYPVPWWWQICHPRGKRRYAMYVFLVVRRRFNRQPMIGLWWLGAHCYPLLRLIELLRAAWAAFWYWLVVALTVLLLWLILAVPIFFVLHLIGFVTWR